MNYEIFLIDNENNILLDTDDIDLTTTFTVSDISDITLRKDTITKNLTFERT